MNSYGTATGSATGVTLPMPPHLLTEEALLDWEEKMAREGLQLSLNDAGQDLLDVIDIPSHVRQHPLGALLISAASGFLLTGSVGTAIRKHAGAMVALVLAFKPLAGLMKSPLVGRFLGDMPLARLLKTRAADSFLSKLTGSPRG